MSVESGRGDNIHKSSLIQESSENSPTSESLDEHTTVAHDGERPEYAKKVEDDPPSPTTLLDHEYPDGGLRAWLVVFGVKLI
jgi:hypothetical protein